MATPGARNAHGSGAATADIINAAKKTAVIAEYFAVSSNHPDSRFAKCAAPSGVSDGRHFALPGASGVPTTITIALALVREIRQYETVTP
jgi:hypothetical protein